MARRRAKNRNRTKKEIAKAHKKPRPMIGTHYAFGMFLESRRPHKKAQI